MNSEKPLIISKKDKVKGLYTFCMKCKKTIDSKVCGDTGKGLRTCKSTEQHCFRAVVAVPNTNGAKRKTRVFNTRNVEEAVRLKFDFEQELKQTDYQVVTTHIEEREEKPSLIIECMAMYIGYLNNEGVQVHKVKKRTTAHIKDVERFFKYFLLSLKSNRIDHAIFRVEQLNDKIVSHFHHYLLDTLNHSNKTYNKGIAQLRQFISWLTDKREYQVANPFIGVTRRAVIINNTTITSKEFDDLLEVIVPENGYLTHPNGKRRNFYRDWMRFAFRLALETGLRREEFMTLKFSDFVEDEEGKLLYLKVENMKVNRILGREPGTGQYKSLPITKGLRKLLNDLDFETKRGSDEYLIGNDETSSRSTLLLVVSKAFPHFWKFTESTKKANLKHLRKTYLTALVQHFGDKATMISDHSGIEVLKKHYVNSQQLAAASTDFKVL
jgi:integrase